MHPIESEYLQMTAQAEATWVDHPGTGKFTGLPVGYSKLGISIGSVYHPYDSLGSFLDLLEQASAEDTDLTLIPKASSHFTFLALAGHHWDSVSDLPQEIDEIKAIVSESLSGFQWRLVGLRIVPGRNFLLLAGVPDQTTIELREKLARRLEASAWRPHIAARYEYQGFPFPPLIWHTTLCRYQHERLSPRLRELYFQFKYSKFGNVELGTPTLRAINYDWTLSHQIL